LAKVLVVEDNPTIGMVMQIALTEEGHVVQLKNNALDGLSYMQKGNIPDIVLTDLIMGGMDGRSLIIKMRHDHRLHDIPAVIITGCIPHPGILPKQHEFQGLLIKPFDIQDVLDTVSQLTSAVAGKAVTGY